MSDCPPIGIHAAWCLLAEVIMPTQYSMSMERPRVGVAIKIVGIVMLFTHAVESFVHGVEHRARARCHTAAAALAAGRAGAAAAAHRLACGHRRAPRDLHVGVRLGEAGLPLARRDVGEY